MISDAQTTNTVLLLQVQDIKFKKNSRSYVKWLEEVPHGDSQTEGACQAELLQRAAPTRGEVRWKINSRYVRDSSEKVGQVKLVNSKLGAQAIFTSEIW